MENNKCNVKNRFVLYLWFVTTHILQNQIVTCQIVKHMGRLK